MLIVTEPVCEESPSPGQTTTTSKSTRSYYRDYSSEYVKDCEDWAKAKGRFSELEYKEGYDTVARLLASTAKPQESVIDIGYGVGKWSTLPAQKGLHVTSVDYLSSTLEQLDGICQEHRIRSRISLTMSDGFYLPFRNEVFDGATLNWVLSHIPVTRNEQFVSEVGRVVKDGGWLFISDSYCRGQEGGKEQIHIRELKSKEYEVYKYYYEPSGLETLMKKTFGDVRLLRPLHYELLCVAEKTLRASLVRLTMPA